MKVSRIDDSLLLALNRSEACLFMMFVLKSINPDQPSTPILDQGCINFVKSMSEIIDATKDDLCHYFNHDTDPTAIPKKKRRSKKQTDQ